MQGKTLPEVMETTHCREGEMQLFKDKGLSCSTAGKSSYKSVPLKNTTSSAPPYPWPQANVSSYGKL